ncbi:MAG: GTPase Era [Bacteroidota bacterium]|nr:GTPase Era [Bacteroidota bacterium]
MNHKSGFVNIIGNPNVGKSTLMNSLVGDKLSIITSKAQTTRHRIMGIVNGPDFQIVYSDTPGILKPEYKLQENMLKYVSIALQDADILIYVTDIYDSFEKNIQFFEKIQKLEIPVLLLINKIDLSNEESILQLEKDWQKVLPSSEIMAISALRVFNTESVFNRIIELLPEGPPYFPEDQLTDRSERFFVSEIIREKILLLYKQEIPYSVEVEVEHFIEEEEIIRTLAHIYVNRESQKAIIIGQKGKALKNVGIQARKDMEDFFGKKIFLELYVKVKKDWKNDERQLKRWGYDH